MHPRASRAGRVAAARRGARRRCSISCASAAPSIRARWTRISRTARCTNYWGGSSSATTHLLDAMHYRGLLRVARRERGIRIYAAHEHGAGPRRRRRARGAHSTRWSMSLVAQVRAAARREPVVLVSRLRYAVPQWRARAEARAAARQAAARARARRWRRLVLAGGASDAERDARRRTPCGCWRRSIRWCGIGGASSCSGVGPTASRPTPRSAKRQRGYYALPLLWRDSVIGWGNLVRQGRRAGRPDSATSTATRRASAAFTRELEAEMDRIRIFLRGREMG